MRIRTVLILFAFLKITVPKAMTINGYIQRIAYCLIALGLVASLVGYVFSYDLLRQGFALGFAGICVAAACAFWQSIQD